MMRLDSADNADRTVGPCIEVSLAGEGWFATVLISNFRLLQAITLAAA
jgi:hypothetical protein